MLLPTCSRNGRHSTGSSNLRPSSANSARRPTDVNRRSGWTPARRATAAFPLSCGTRPRRFSPASVRRPAGGIHHGRGSFAGSRQRNASRTWQYTPARQAAPSYGRVAVIDDVDELRAPRDPADDARQQDVAIEESVGVEADSPIEGEAREDAAKLRRDLFRDERRREVCEELVRAQIHARPALRREVADHREPHRHETTFSGFRHAPVRFRPLLLSWTWCQSGGTGNSSRRGHMSRSSTMSHQPGRSFARDTRMQAVR